MKKVFLLSTIFVLSLAGCGNNDKNRFTIKPSGKEVTREEFLESAKNCKYASETYGFRYKGKATITGFYESYYIHLDEQYADEDREETYEGSITYDFRTDEIIESNFSRFINDYWGKEFFGPDDAPLYQAANIFINSTNGMLGERTIYQLIQISSDFDYHYFLKPAQLYYVDECSEKLINFNKEGLISKTTYQFEDQATVQYYDTEREELYKCKYQFTVTYS